MQIFITGTDTNVGKTLISSWLCLHTSYDYFKPIQTGTREESDSNTVKTLSNCITHKETYTYKEPVSPHLAAKLEGEDIDISKIKSPNVPNLIIEGAGGVLVPINQKYLMVDLIKQMEIPVILVATSTLGTINHTLLSLEALRSRNIPVLGVIINGEPNQDNCEAIEFYGKSEVLAQLPKLNKTSKESLLSTPLNNRLKTIFEKKNEIK